MKIKTSEELKSFSLEMRNYNQKATNVYKIVNSK